MVADSADQTAGRQMESIGAVLLDTFGSAPAAAEGWRVGPATPGRAWIEVGNDIAGSPLQGWKLHISATAESAATVLRRVMPVLRRRPAGFKVAASLHHLERLNSGDAGLTQVGKFITIYPVDDLQAVHLAVAIDRATRGLTGPAVPSDRPLRPGSLVHYRYGAFTLRYLQTALGEVVPALAAPDGALIPDPRTINYRVPPWAIDPFVAAGVTAPRPRPSLLIGGRYLTVALLQQGPRSTVRLVVEVESGARRVLKQARGDAGRIAAERLRHEAAVLDAIGPDARFPRRFDLFEHSGDLFLAIEHCDGPTLEQHITRLTVRDGAVPIGQVLAWGRDLTSALGALHARGIVHNDLKPPNLIVAPDTSLRLIDFETASRPGVSPAPEDAGTPGYLSPQRLAGDPPTVADEVYSVGALLYYLLTGADPSHAPDPRSLLDRPIARFNPAAPRRLVQVVAQCLRIDPAERFASMAQLAAALSSSIGDGRRAPAPVRTSPETDRTAARRRYRNLARRLGASLCDAAIPAGDDDARAWPSTDPTAPGLLLRDVNRGAAGAVLALADLTETLGGAALRRTLRAGARWLQSAPPFGGPPLPGLYVGEAGIGAALLRAGQALDDADLIAAAEARGRLVAALPHASPDLFNGSAGRLRFHLFLWDATGNHEHLRAAIDAGDHLLSCAETPAAGERSWPIPEGYGAASGRTYLGYAHGAAGIADALLDLADATGHDRFAAAARDAGSRLARLAEPALPGGEGVDWSDLAGGNRCGAAWCHGATGIGRFFLHAAARHLLPEAADLARRAARTAAHGARWAGPSQCHGLAGSVEFLLDSFRSTGNRTHLAAADDLTRLLVGFAVNHRSGSASAASEARAPDLMVGYAGVAVCLLRLSDPERLPHVLSRDAFRPRRPAVSAVA